MEQFTTRQWNASFAEELASSVPNQQISLHALNAKTTESLDLTVFAPWLATTATSTMKNQTPARSATRTVKAVQAAHHSTAPGARSACF